MGMKWLHPEPPGPKNSGIKYEVRGIHWYPLVNVKPKDKDPNIKTTNTLNISLIELLNTHSYSKLNKLLFKRPETSFSFRSSHIKTHKTRETQQRHRTPNYKNT